MYPNPKPNPPMQALVVFPLILFHNSTIFDHLYNQIITQMNRSGKQKHLKCSLSFETDCASEDRFDRNIKINIINPNKNTSSKIKPYNQLDSIKQGEEILIESRRKKEEISITTNRSSRIPGLTLNATPKNDSELNNVKDQNISKIVKNNPYSQSRAAILIKNTISQTQNCLVSPKSGIKPEFGKSSIKSSHFKQQKAVLYPQRNHLTTMSMPQSDRNQKNDNFQINLSRDESSDRDSQVIDMIDIDEKIITRPSEIENLFKTPFFKAAPSSGTKITERNQKIQATALSQRSNGEKSSSKMKLRDYLYMVEATSKTGLNKKQTSLKKQDSLSFSQHESAQKKQYPPISMESSVKTTRSTPMTPRREALSQKYNISNGAMLQILRKQIHEDIKLVTLQLQMVDEELADLNFGQRSQPTNEELLVLYTIRRQIKEQMNKKLETALQSIKTHKKSQISKSTPVHPS